MVEALRLNTTVTSLNLGFNDLRAEVRSALRQRVEARGPSVSATKPRDPGLPDIDWGTQ